MPIATVTSKGQVTIPKEIRDACHIKAGTELLFIHQPDGTITVRPRTRDLRDMIGMLKATRHATIEDMNEAIAAGWAGEPEA